MSLESLVFPKVFPESLVFPKVSLKNRQRPRIVQKKRASKEGPIGKSKGKGQELRCQEWTKQSQEGNQEVSERKDREVWSSHFQVKDTHQKRSGRRRRNCKEDPLCSSTADWFFLNSNRSSSQTMFFLIFAGFTEMMSFFHYSVFIVLRQGVFGSPQGSKGRGQVCCRSLGGSPSCSAKSTWSCMLYDLLGDYPFQLAALTFIFPGKYSINEWIADSISYVQHCGFMFSSALSISYHLLFVSLFLHVLSHLPLLSPASCFWFPGIPSPTTIFPFS